MTAERFARIPEALLRDTTVSASAVRLYGVLARHGATSGDCYPGHPRIAEWMGAAERSIGAWARELEQAGWISREERRDARGRKAGTAYVLRMSSALHSAVDVTSTNSEDSQVEASALHRAVDDHRAPQRATSALHSAVDDDAATSTDAANPQLASSALHSAPTESNRTESHMTEPQRGGTRDRESAPVDNGDRPPVTFDDLVARFARLITTPARQLEPDEIPNTVAALVTEHGPVLVRKWLDALHPSTRYRWPSKAADDCDANCAAIRDVPDVWSRATLTRDEHGREIAHPAHPDERRT
jgi:Helix-turn-helix domain